VSVDLVCFGARDYDPQTGRWTALRTRSSVPEESPECVEEEFSGVYVS
jgi:hypothetical protein